MHLLLEFLLYFYVLLQLLWLGPTTIGTSHHLPPPSAHHQTASTTLAPPPRVKRGLAESPRLGMQCLDYNFASQSHNNKLVLSFIYNWGPEPQCPHHSSSSTIPPPDPTTGHLGFIPMVWGKHTLNRTIAPTSASAILGFNEPNHRRQANMSPAEAASYWPRFLEVAHRHNISKIGSPAAAPCHHNCNGGDALEWFHAFFEKCGRGGCRVDFIATHFYGCNEQHLIEYLTKLYNAFGKPIWLTEFNCGGGSSVNSVAQQIKWMKTAIPILEALPFVHHYSWMSGRDSHLPAASLFHGNGDTISLTTLGKIYVSL